MQRLTRIGRALALARPTRSRRIRVDSTIDLVPILSPGYSRPAHLADIFAKLDRVPFERVLMCVSLPPRHFKSTSAHHYVARLLERHPWMKVLYLSYGATFAAENVALIQQLAVAAGVELGRVQRQDRFTTSSGGGVWSAGFDGSLTGRGFHLIIIDDPVKNRAEAESAIIRAKINRAIISDVLTRGQPSGPKAFPRGFAGTSVVVLATRWHEDDPTGNLVGTSPNASPDAPRFEYHNLPAIDAEGRALAPDFWTLEQLLEIKSRTPHYDFVSLYQGRPEPAGGRKFGDTHLIEIGAIPREGRFAIGVDFGHGKKRRSDRHAVGTMQRTGDRFFIRYVHAERSALTSTDYTKGDKRTYSPGFVQYIRGQQDAWPGARTAQHVGGPEDFTLDLLGRLEASERVHITGIPAKVDKVTRAQHFIHDWNHGRVFLPIGPEWVSALVTKLMAWTGADGEEDDEIDALVTAHHLLTEGDGLAVLTRNAANGAPPTRVTSASRRRGVYVG